MLRKPLSALLRQGWLPLLIAAAMVLCTALMYLHSTHQRSGAWLSAPLDDTFIHFQYAKQLIRGEVLRYNDGDSPTTGATSLLYMVLLSPGWLLGFKGLKMLVWAWMLNGMLHVIGGLAVFSCVSRLTSNRPLAYTGMAAFLFNGHMLWGAFSHMEIALFSTLVLLTLRAAIMIDQDSEPEPNSDADSSPHSEFRVPPSALLCGCLLALVRPEGSLLAGGFTLWLLWRHLGGSLLPLRKLPGRLWRARRLAWPVLAGVGMILLFVVLTGRLGTNANLKSHLTLLPYDVNRYLEMSLGWLPMTMEILLDKWPRTILPLITLLLLLGLGGWAAAGRLRRPGAGGLVLGWLALLTLFYALMFARRDHFDRYYLPYLGLTVVVMWWCLGEVGRRIPKLRAAPAVVGGLILLMMVPHTRFWAKRYGDNCRDLVHQHFKVAAWVAKNTPPGSRIMVNDAGAIPYLSGRYTHDVVGLASNAFYKLKKVIPFSDAPAWEALEALPNKPHYTVAYPEWIPQMFRFRVFQSIQRFPLRNRTMVANETKVVWKMRWDLMADSAAAPGVTAPARVVDRLDVAFIRSEQEHDYDRLDRDTPRGTLLEDQLPGGKALIDGGRHLKEGEAFSLRATPGRAATLKLRVRGYEALDLSVSVNGAAPLAWKHRATGGTFGVATLSIPARLVTDDELVLRVEAARPYTSFHYWLVQ